MQISPGMAHLPSRLCLSDLRRSVPYKFRALMIWDISPRYAASYPLPVRQASALPSASSRFAVARDTLAVQLTLPLVGRVEDFHLQVSAPCRAQSSRGRGYPRRPLTPPDVRFRIRRFIEHTGVVALYRAATPDLNDQRLTLGKPGSCGLRHCSTRARAG